MAIWRQPLVSCFVRELTVFIFFLNSLLRSALALVIPVGGATGAPGGPGRGSAGSAGSRSRCRTPARARESECLSRVGPHADVGARRACTCALRFKMRVRATRNLHFIEPEPGQNAEATGKHTGRALYFIKWPRTVLS